MRSLIDIGYTWPWTHGHLVVTALALPLWWLARRLGWPRIVAWLAAAAAVWSVAAFLVVQFVFRFNEVPDLPTPAFAAAGPARVLDMGAGSGRSSLMVLRARPDATLVALDNFSATYIRGHGPEKTRANLRAAGVEHRTTVVSADMRRLPFPADSFDAVLSVAAIDHLDRAGIAQALAEAARVLRPDGDFLLEVISPDAWMRFAWGPLVLHGARPDRLRAAWTSRVEQAGFTIIEVGALPIRLYVLARKPAAARASAPDAAPQAPQSGR